MLLRSFVVYIKMTILNVVNPKPIIKYSRKQNSRTNY